MLTEKKIKKEIEPKHGDEAKIFIKFSKKQKWVS